MSLKRLAGGLYDVSEPDSEYVQLFDSLTGGTLICANRSHALSKAWVAKYATNSPLVDVTKVIPFNKSDGFAFTHDTFIDNRLSKLHKYMRMLVDFACLLHFHLSKNEKVLVFCKNGRSRSPCIILAFLLLRGLPREQAVTYLTHAFQTQRPTIANRSANFPNFDKFMNVTLLLETEIWNNEEWINERISTCAKLFPSRLARGFGRGCAILKEDDVGTVTVGDVALRASLPFTSFCPSINTLSNSTSSSSFSSSSSSTTSSSTTSSFTTATSSLSGSKRKHRVVEKSSNISYTGKGRGSDPNVLIVGRRVRVSFGSLGVFVGTLQRCCCVTTNLWEVLFDDGKLIELSGDVLSNAFPVGTRVTVNWQNDGDWFDGVVWQWDGSDVYQVWYDIERKRYNTAGGQMFITDKVLADNCPTYIRNMTLVENGDEDDDEDDKDDMELDDPEESMNNTNMNRSTTVTSSSVNRTHPRRKGGKKRSMWTDEEVTKLNTGLIKYPASLKKGTYGSRSRLDWIAIARFVGSRSVQACKYKNYEFLQNGSSSSNSSSSNKSANLVIPSEAKPAIHAEIQASTSSATGFKGVQRIYKKWENDRFRAYIETKDTQTSLGNYDTAKQAALAYDHAARKLGRNCVNFPLVTPKVIFSKECGDETCTNARKGTTNQFRCTSCASCSEPVLKKQRKNQSNKMSSSSTSSSSSSSQPPRFQKYYGDLMWVNFINRGNSSWWPAAQYYYSANEEPVIVYPTLASKKPTRVHDTALKTAVPFLGTKEDIEKFTKGIQRSKLLLSYIDAAKKIMSAKIAAAQSKLVAEENCSRRELQEGRCMRKEDILSIASYKEVSAVVHLTTESLGIKIYQLVPVKVASLNQYNIPIGASIIKIGTKSTEKMNMNDFIATLKNANRPVNVTFDWSRTWIKLRSV